MTQELPKFRNNNNGKVYTLFLITNINSDIGISQRLTSISMKIRIGGHDLLKSS